MIVLRMFIGDSAKNKPDEARAVRAVRFVGRASRDPIRCASVAMGNALKGAPEHSADYFGDTRDHWWHDDFIEMVAKRWRLESARAILDVGCGVGHWGRVLARVLPADAELIGVDREPRWVREATERASAVGLGGRFTYRVGTAESLPFRDGTFDVVTCQTLLMHVRDPAATLAEMVRVTRPGGLIIAAEPTNVASRSSNRSPSAISNALWADHA